MFADYGQPSQPARPSFVEIPNPRVTTAMGRIEVTDVRPETVTGKLLDAQDQLVLEYGHPVYVCVPKTGIMCPTEKANMMTWWHLAQPATDSGRAALRYSIETLINRLDGMNRDELYALRTFVCLESDPFQAYSGTVNSDLSHLNSWFVTVRALSSVERNRLVAAICNRTVAATPNEALAPNEALNLVRAIADQFSCRQLHPCWQELLSTSTDIQKKALIEAIAYAQHYSCTVFEALQECDLLNLFPTSEHLNVWMSEIEAIQMIHLLSGSLLARGSETLPNVGDGRDGR
ncbi:hypothetical protein QUA82_33215 [Microcoleus sp. F8-D3]